MDYRIIKSQIDIESINKNPRIIGTEYARRVREYEKRLKEIKADVNKNISGEEKSMEKIIDRINMNMDDENKRLHHVIIKSIDELGRIVRLLETTNAAVGNRDYFPNGSMLQDQIDMIEYQIQSVRMELDIAINGIVGELMDK